MHLNLTQNPKAISLHSEQINPVEQLMILSILVSECLNSETWKSPEICRF